MADYIYALIKGKQMLNILAHFIFSCEVGSYISLLLITRAK